MPSGYAQGRARTQAATQRSGNTVSSHALRWSAVIPGALLFGARPAFADVPVALVFVLAPFVAWWATIAGLIFEGFCIWRFLGVNWRRSAAGVLAANFFSTVIGVIPIMILGVPIQLGLESALAGTEPMMQLVAGFGTAQLLLPVINAAIELPVLFLFGVPRSWRSAKIIYAANFVSIALLMGALALHQK